MSKEQFLANILSRRILDDKFAGLYLQYVAEDDKIKKFKLHLLIAERIKTLQRLRNNKVAIIIGQTARHVPIDFLICGCCDAKYVENALVIFVKRDYEKCY